MSALHAEVAATRAAQGLPPTVADPQAVRRLAAILKAMERRRG